MAVDVVVYDKVDKESEKIQDALYALYPQQTITDAAIASFADGSDGIPVKKLVVGVEPAQDLHGYDSPWPAGGGVNLLDADGYSFPTEAGTDKTTTINKLAYLKAGVTYTFSCRQVASAGTATRNLLGVVTETGTTSLAWEQDNSAAAHVHQVTFTPSTSGYYRPIYWAHTLGTAVTVDQFQCEKGSAFTSYSPYSNECPISGWTGAEIEGCGANLFNKDTATAERRVSTVNGGLASATNQHASDYILVKPGGTYTLNFSYYSSGDFGMAFYDKNKTFVSGIKQSSTTSSSTSPFTFTVPVNAYYLRFSNEDNTRAIDAITLVPGNSAGADTLYTESKEISVTFPSEAGTVYGGSDELVSGGLVSTLAKTKLNQLSGWSERSTPQSGIFRAYISDALQPPNRMQPTSAISDTLKAKGYQPITESDYGCFSISDGADTLIVVPTNGKYNTVESFLADMGNIEIVYPLATPQTYQLDPITISTLYGTNNIWADCGSIQKLTYRADIGKYIDSHITTAVANALNA